MVASGAAASTCTKRRPRLGRRLDLGAARVHHLHVRGDIEVREPRPQPPHGLQAHALNQRRPRLQNIRAPCGRFLRDLQGAIQFQEIQRHLQARRYVRLRSFSFFQH